NGSATKPGDVHTARNGKTVEISNTDAEGRLVLADLLCYASEKKPAAIIDAATLTGAMVVALGDLHTGYYTSNDKLAKKVNDAAANSGELVWRMPVLQEHMGDMRGTYSDLNNMGSPSRKAGSAQAAGFLKEFVPEEIPYAHFDIAGTAWSVGNRLNYIRGGASGCMVRTFVEIAKQWKA
ncbi:MAG: aminopeptidase, partial [Bdellovibrionales bacterium]|nr:aminopeptidase [Bdellovibrionales bacterium]